MNNIEKNAADLLGIKVKVDKIKSPDNLEALLEIENSNARRITVIENDIKAFKKYLGID